MRGAQSRAIPLTRSVALKPFVDFLEKGGTAVEPLLKETRIDPEFLQKPESFFSFLQASRFIKLAAHREGIEDFGLQTGAATPITSLGLLGVILANSLTLRDFIRRLSRWVPSTNTGAEVRLGMRNEEIAELRIHYHAEEGRSQTDAYLAMLMTDGIRMVHGPDWRPSEIALNEAAGRVVRRHEAFSEAKVNTNVEHVGIQFPRSSLGLPLRLREKKSCAETERLMQTTTPPKNFEETLAIALKGLLIQGPLKVEIAAELAGISVRTLHRRLAEVWTSYGSLLDRIRFEKAVELMDDPGMMHVDIAFRLGYSDPANFTRAFRRWTGISPKAFRKRRNLAAEAVV